MSRYRTWSRAAVLTSACAAVVGLAAGAHATTPGTNGRIAFLIAGEHDQIATINADGTGRRQLTRRGDAASLQPDWSPDGKRIVFERDKPRPNSKPDSLPIIDVYVMNADGKHVVKLSHTTLRSPGAEAPAWSPDGRTIVFDRPTLVGGKCCVSPIFTMSPSGKNVHQITKAGPVGAYEPQWSPDGTRFVYTGFRRSDGRAAIFTIKVDGTDRRQLTDWGLDAHSPDWSPDGSRIVFSSSADYHATFAPNIFTVRPDGSELKQLTFNPPGERNRTNAPRSSAPTWSPDGSRITYSHTPGSGSDEFADIFSMRADGTDARLVTRTAKQWEKDPDWGPALR